MIIQALNDLPAFSFYTGCVSYSAHLGRFDEVASFLIEIKVVGNRSITTSTRFRVHSCMDIVVKQLEGLENRPKE